MSTSEVESGVSTEWLVGVCRQFGVRVESDDDEILDGGTSSLTIMKIIAKVEDTYGIDSLPPEDLFEDSRVGAVVKVIERNRTQPSSDGGTASGVG